MPRLALVVEIRTHPGRKEAFLARLATHRTNVLANEPGCQHFHVLEAVEMKDTVFLYEVYDDEKALEDHAATSYFQAYRTDTDAMIAERRRTVCQVTEG